MVATNFDQVMERIERKLDQHGMTDREASLKAVGKPDMIRDMKRRRGLPTSERLARLASLLGTTTDWLLHGGLEGPILDRSALNRDGTLAAHPRGASAAASDVRAAWTSPEPHRPVPLVRSAFGGEWEADVEMTELRLSDVLDHLSWPTSPAMDPGCYALEIVGESMAPRFDPGERAFVSPLSPVRIGDDVLVQLRAQSADEQAVDAASGGRGPRNEATLALIKRLKRWTPEFVELSQFNPAKTFRVAAERVAAVHRVKARF